jgi:hypothetical protein
MSSRGSTWSKKQHSYDKRVNKRYYYSYESMLKKLWKLKQANDPRYEELKAQYDAERKAKGNAHVAKVYNDVADKTHDKGIRKKAEEFQRKSNDAKLKKTKKIKLASIASDTLNRGKLILARLLKRKK